MEIAIPLIALGGMYVVSNQNNQKCNDTNKLNSKTNKSQNNKENFANMGRQINYLPNNVIPPQNYPVENLNEISDTVNNYANPNTATDKYFNQNVYEEKSRKGVSVGQNPQQIYSLTGNYLDTEQFKHNNMVPIIRIII